jgi:hypothetical protein
MEPLIIDSIIEKIDASVVRIGEQEKVITEISQKVSQMSDQSSTIKNVAELVKNLQDNMYNIRWPVKEMTEVSNRLAENNELLSNPRKTKQVIFHTAGRLLWVIVGLFIGMVFLVMGWINTSNKLDQFRMHDIMWRYVKLTNHSQNLEYLQSVENLYVINPDKMQSLVEKEELSLKQISETTQKSLKDGLFKSNKVNDTATYAPRKKRSKMKDETR